MALDVLLGLQWGDEGKGKIVDFLAQDYHIIARFQGGPNAGHTLKIGTFQHVLHQIPSGIFHPHAENIIGNGVVLDPVVFKQEIQALAKSKNYDKQRLLISQKAQIILPTHKLLDQAYEQAKGNKKIGSTLKGIGPTYEDKVSRVGLRVGDLVSQDFESKYQTLKNRHLRLLASYDLAFEWEDLEAKFHEGVEFLKSFRLIDSAYYINEHLDAQKSVLAEGAQGSLLDIDFGSYPYVTSSNTTTAAACTGLGVAANKIKSVFGVFKAYCTRVGSGPFPTELHSDMGHLIREKGGEYGATTGRPRRCGWLDLPALKYAIMLNGATELYMMKADVLSGIDTLEVCTAYRLADGTTTDQLPFDLASASLTPVYETLDGWSEDLSQVSTYDDLPDQAKAYIRFIEKSLGLPIHIVSVGPDRAQTLVRAH